MARVADEILVNIMVDKSRADRDAKSWEQSFDRSMKSTERSAIRAEQTIRRSSDAIGGHLRTLAGAIAAGVSTREITRLLDSYTQLENRLKVVGLEGRNLTEVQNRLFESANKNGTAVNGMAELYSRMGLSQKELGATQEQLLAVTGGVAAALRVQGLSAEEASGPLLQMAQAMGAGVVRAEEFNSMVEGMPVLIQAVAKHIDGANGSIAGLRQMMMDGEVTSKQFFDALLAGLPEIEAKAAQATLTIGQSMTVLNNELIKYAGQVDASLGVTEKFSAMIMMLSGNLDKIAPAVAVIAAVLGGRFLAGIVGTTAASIAQALAFERSGGAALIAAAKYDQMTASTARLMTASELAAAKAAFAAGQMSRMQISMGALGTGAARAGSAIMGAFGGPVGLAVTGLTVALSGLAVEAYNTSQDILNLRNEINEADDTIAKFQTPADTASGSVADIGTEADIASPKIQNFAGKVGEAAQKLWDLARAKQAASLAELEGQRTQLSQSISNTQQNLPENIGARLNNRSVNSLKDVFEPIGARIVQIAKDTWTGGQYTTDNRSAIASGRQGLDRLDAAIEAARTKSLEDYAKEVVVPTATASGGKKDKSSRSAEAAAARAEREREREAREALQRARNQEDDLYRLGDAMIQAMMGRQLTAQERAELDLKMLERDRDANKRMIEREVLDGDKTRAEADTLLELEDAVYLERKANREREAQVEIAEERTNAERALLDMQTELIRIQIGSAKSAAESRRLQLELLKIQQKAVRDELESRISRDPTLDAAGMRDALTKLEVAQEESIIQSTMGPMEAWLQQSQMTAEQVKEAYEAVAVKGLDMLGDAFADIITGTKSAKEAFADMARSILSDIAKMEAKRLIYSIFNIARGGGGGIPITEGGRGFREGGLFRGKGTGTSDSNTIKVSDHEYIVNSKATKKFLPLLEAINKDRLPAFRNGGLVGSAAMAGALPSMMGASPTQVFYVDAQGSILADALVTQLQAVGAKQAAEAGLGAISYQQSRAQRSANRQNKRFV